MSFFLLWEGHRKNNNYNFMKEGFINSTDDAQQREKQAEKVAKFIDKTGLYEYVKKILNNGIEKPNFEKFKNFLIRINGIARDIPISERSLDGKNVQLSGMSDVQVPKHEDKEDILKYAYDSLDKVRNEDLKFLIPALINAIHFFADGNGRTSRTINQLLSGHASKEDFQNELKTSLGKYGRLDSIDADPDLIHDDIQKKILDKNGWKLKDERYCIGNVFRTANNEFNGMDTNNENYSNLKKFFTLTHGINDQEYALTALSKIMGAKIDSLLTEKYNTKGLISFYKLAELVTQDEWENIFKEYYKLKKDHVKMIVDIFTNPDEFISEDNPEENLKNKFIKNILQKHKNNQ